MEHASRETVSYPVRYGEMKETQPPLEEMWHSDKDNMKCILQAPISHTRLSSAQLKFQPSQFIFLQPTFQVPTSIQKERGGGGASKHNKHTKRSNRH